LPASIQGRLDAGEPGADEPDACGLELAAEDGLEVIELPQAETKTSRTAAA